MLDTKVRSTWVQHDVTQALVRQLELYKNRAPYSETIAGAIVVVGVIYSCSVYATKSVDILRTKQIAASH